MSQTISSVDELASTIKNERMSKGISQRTLAKMSGIGNATVSQLEKGVCCNVNARTLISICSALDINLVVTKKADE